MRPFVLSLLAFVLVGCGDDGAPQRQAMAQCTLDPRSENQPKTGTFLDTNYPFLDRCMASKGFVSDPKLCLKKSDFTWLEDADCYRADNKWTELLAKFKAWRDSN